MPLAGHGVELRQGEASATAARAALTAARTTFDAVVPRLDAAQAQFSGRVASSFFLGDHTRLVIDAGGDTTIVARVQDRRVFHPGDTVHGAIDAQAVLSLPGAAE